MRLFGRKASAAVLASLEDVRRERADDRELASLAEMNGDLSKAIERAIRKSMTWDAFNAFESSDEQGGYFGLEFDIRSTAGRIKSLYTREPWIYATASKITKTLAIVPMKVRDAKTKEVIEKHPVQELLNMGSPLQSSLELRWAEGIDLVLGGNYFILLEEDYKKVAGIAPVELVNFVFDSARQRVTAIQVQQNGVASNQAKTFPIEQVVHVKFPNPFSPFYGLSPFCAAARPILLDRMKGEFEMAFYLRGATSNGVIETTEDLSKSRFKRLMLSFEQAFTGKSNWWRTLFLPKGATWKQASLTMAEAQHLEGLRENRKTILATIGIPPSIVGLTEDVNRATSEQQQQVYWGDTIIPIAEFRASGWNNSYLLKQVYKGKVEVFADFSGIDAVEGFVVAKGEKSKAMAPYFLIDEIREKVWGAEPLPDGLGQRFVAEVRPQGAGALTLALPGVAPQALPTPVKAVVPDGFEVQGLVFAKEIYKAKSDVESWCFENGYGCEEVEETAGAWHVRQVDVDLFEAETMKTIMLSDGVQARIGKRLPADDGGKSFRASVKDAATSSQNRAEDRLARDMGKAYEGYIEKLLEIAAVALRKRSDVRRALSISVEERQAKFFDGAKDVYGAALERGFSAANANVKRVAGVSEKRARFTGLTETDQQAVDVLRERTRDGQRRALEQRSISAFRGFDATRTDAIMGLIEAGEREGLSLEKIAETIRERYDEAYRNQARTIVRTEILSAYSAGLAWNFEVLGQVFSEVRKEWMHQGDEDINSDARQEHVALDGTEVGQGEAFEVVDPDTGETVSLRYPRDPLAPAGQVINCFPASTAVEAFGVEKCFSRFYRGPMVTLHLTGGKQLSATTNHPILTPKGWIGIGSLHEGDHVFDAAGLNPSLAGHHDVDRIQSGIGEAFKSLANGHHLRGVAPGHRGDFHGDGAVEEVQVIDTHGSLRYREDAVGFERDQQIVFPAAHLREGTGLGDRTDFTDSGHISTTSDRIGWRDMALAGVELHPRPAHGEGLAPAARLDPDAIQAPVYGRATDAEQLADLKNRAALVDVQAREIVRVDVEPFWEGHVYNLQTVSGWYLAGGLLVHNCRCTMGSVIPDSAISNAEAILETT